MPARKVPAARPGRRGRKAAAVHDLVGNTPLVEIEGVLVKVESFNPTGSVKDRMAWYMARKAEDRGELKPGATIIEVTSGNTGIAFAMIAARKGYRFIAVMPESMSIERRKMMKAFGAEIVLTPAKEDMAGAMRRYEELVKKNPGAWLPRQFENPDNPAAHQRGLGREILAQTGGRLDAFVAGMGTGGTLAGVARALKKADPKIRIVGVEPAESAVLTGGPVGFHKIQGIGEGFVPKIVQDHRHLIDEIVVVASDDAIAESNRLAREHGLFVGISSGANFLAAKRLRAKHAVVVTLLCDGGERYLSSRG
jgi:cysteine synthase A